MRFWLQEKSWVEGGNSTVKLTQWKSDPLRMNEFFFFQNLPNISWSLRKIGRFGDILRWYSFHFSLSYAVLHKLEAQWTRMFHHTKQKKIRGVKYYSYSTENEITVQRMTKKMLGTNVPNFKGRQHIDIQTTYPLFSAYNCHIRKQDLSIERQLCQPVWPPKRTRDNF